MKNIKRVLKEFIPPILLKIGKKRNPIKSCFSYDEAERLSKKGYQNSELVELIITKTLNYASEIEKNVDCNISELSHLIGISAVSKPTVNVIDFGGAAGCHYFSARKALPKNVTLNWCVVETDLMVHECNKNINIPNLNFFKTIADAKFHLGNVDLVISNSALQYTPQPIDTLKILLGTETENIFIVRTPFHSGDKPLFYVQSSLLGGNGPGKNPEYFKNIDKMTEYPLTVESLRNFRNVISADYNINLSWEEESNAFNNIKAEIRTYGFMASRKII